MGPVHVAHKLSTQAHLPHSMWNPRRPGTESVSSALAGRFPVTSPPRKPQGVPFLSSGIRDSGGCRSGPGGRHPCAPPSAFTSYSVSSQKDQHEHLGQIVLGPWCPRAGPMEISGMGCWVRAGLPWGNVLPRLGYTCGVFYHINDKRLQTAVQLWAASVRTELVSGREEEPLASPYPWRCDLGRPLPRKWDVWVKITGRN